MNNRMKKQKSKLSILLVFLVITTTLLGQMPVGANNLQSELISLTQKKAMIASGKSSYSEIDKKLILASDDITLSREGTPENIDVTSLIPYMNYRSNIDRKPINNLISLINDSKERSDSRNSLDLFTRASSQYGDAWPYSATSSNQFNCYAYSQGYTFWLNPGDLYYPNGGLVVNPSQFQIQCYFDPDVIAYNVGLDLDVQGISSRVISGPTASISSSERRIALKVGIHDFNNDGYIDLNSAEADYHFMLQHSNGAWSEKHGSYPSVYDGFINPSTFSWDLGSKKNYYDSEIKYMAIE